MDLPLGDMMLHMYEPKLDDVAHVWTRVGRNARPHFILQFEWLACKYAFQKISAMYSLNHGFDSDHASASFRRGTMFIDWSSCIEKHFGEIANIHTRTDGFLYI